MTLFVRIVGILALSVAVSGPAAADESPALTAKICAAAAKITSFVGVSSVPGTTGVTSETTFVRPQKMKSVTTIGTLTVEAYLVDDTMYLHTPQVGWQKMALSQVSNSPLAIDIADRMKSSKVNYLPDRQEGGTTVGVYEVATPLPSTDSTLPAPGATAAPAAPQQTLTCTYDKTTYLTRTCGNAMMTITYTKYNDPANVVDLPPEAKNATSLLPPQPAGAAASPKP